MGWIVFGFVLMANIAGLINTELGGKILFAYFLCRFFYKHR